MIPINGDKQQIKNRLSRIEGQIKGIKKMIDEEKYCADILIQIAAVRAAVTKVGEIILKTHSKECVLEAINNKDDGKLDELIDIFFKFTI